MVRHIIHVTVKPLRKPCLEPFFSMRQVDIGDADRIETEFGTLGTDLRHERVHAGRIGWQACIQVRFG